MGRDDVDESADGVGAVQQRRRPPHDLDPFGDARVDRDAVIAGLARQVARANPILQNQHAVTVESANDRPARTRTEAAAGDAGLPLQNVPETAVQLPDQVERVQRRHRIECLERRLGAARRCGDGYVLVHGRQAELEVDRGGPARRQGDHLPARGQMLPLGEHLVAARRNIADLEAAVLRSQADKPRTHDQDHRSVNRAAVLRQRHRAAHGAGILCPRRRGRHCECGQQNGRTYTAP